MTGRIRLPVLSGSWARAAIAPVLVFIATATDHHYLADFWHHLARGRAMVTEGRLVDADRFTYTVDGRPFQDVNWLTQVCYYGLYSRGGLALVQGLNSLLLAAVMALLVHLCWRTSGSMKVAGGLGVLTFFGLWRVLTIRPQTLSFLLFILLYEVLTGAERRRWLLVLPPALLALWANVHGAFPAGLLLIGGFLLAAGWEGWAVRRWGLMRDGRTWPLALCLAASTAATLVNPYGWKICLFVETTSSLAVGRGIEEWLPPGTDAFIGKAWLLSLMLLLVAFALPRRRPAVRDVCLVVVFLPLAGGSARMVPWWLLVIAPVVARLLAAPGGGAESRVSERPSFAAAVAFGLMVLLALLSVPGLDRYNPLLGPDRRAGHRTEDDLEAVARSLRARGRTGRLFSRLEWSEYLTWSLGTPYRVFMDGRIDIIPDEVWGQYGVVTRAQPGWQKILDSYRVDYLLLDREFHGNTGLLPQVEGSPSWEAACQAGPAVLFVRRPAPGLPAGEENREANGRRSPAGGYASATSPVP